MSVSSPFVEKCCGQMGSHQGLMFFSLLNTRSTSAEVPNTASDRHADNASKMKEEVRMVLMVLLVILMQKDGGKETTAMLESHKEASSRKEREREWTKKSDRTSTIGQWVNIGSRFPLVLAYFLPPRNSSLDGTFLSALLTAMGRVSARLTS